MQMASLGQIQGYIKNLSDGDAEVVAYLWEDQIKDMLAILQNGSPLSKVENITYETIELDEDEIVYDGFEIRS